MIDTANQEQIAVQYVVATESAGTKQPVVTVVTPRKERDTGRKAGNRHARRKAQSLLRRQLRALARLGIPKAAGDLPLTGMTQLMLLRLAYRALKRGSITRRQARILGCRV